MQLYSARCLHIVLTCSLTTLFFCGYLKLALTTLKTSLACSVGSFMHNRLTYRTAFSDHLQCFLNDYCSKTWWFWGKLEQNVVQSLLHFCLTNVRGCQVKAKLPRRESERRNHPLARHVDILSAIETRLSLLSMTYSKYIDLGLCCFIPGKVVASAFVSVSLWATTCIFIVRVIVVHSPLFGDKLLLLHAAGGTLWEYSYQQYT